MKNLLFLAFSLFANTANAGTCNTVDNCVTFSVGSGTGCAWMCEHCANSLGTNNYYFTDGVCSYAPGGCVGNPQVGVDYTCCAGTINKFVKDDIVVFIDNTQNSPANNPPGFNQWVGGEYKGDPAGIKVDKTDTHLAYKLPEDTASLLTWYYNWGWYSGKELNGPWKNGDVISLPPVSSD